MKLILKTAASQSLQVVVHEDDTFESLQQRMCEETGINVDLCQIGFEDRAIIPCMNVIHYFMPNGQPDSQEDNGYGNDAEDIEGPVQTRIARLQPPQRAQRRSRHYSTDNSEGPGETPSLRLPSDSENEPGEEGEDMLALRLPTDTENELEEHNGTATARDFDEEDSEEEMDRMPWPRQQLCRLCAVPRDGMTLIFNEEGIHRELATMINAWLPTRVSRKDHLPKQVCGSCIHQLEQCQRFGTAVIQAENALKKLFQSSRGILKNPQPLSETVNEDVENKNTSVETNATGTEHKIPTENKSCPLCCEGHMNTVDCSEELKVDSEPETVYSDDSEAKFERKLRTYLDMDSDDDFSVSDLSVSDKDDVSDKEEENEERKNGKAEVEELNAKLLEEGGQENERRPDFEDMLPMVKLETNLTCRICEETLNDIEQCMLHSIQVHGNAEKRFFPCILCIVCFGASTELTRHFSYKHGFMPSKAPPNLELEYLCYPCNTKFKSHEELMSHACDTENKFRCNDCGAFYTDKNKFYFHVQLHNGGEEMDVMKCGTCKEVFDDEDKFYEHCKSAHGEIPGKLAVHVCDLCGRTYQSRSSYLIHRRRHARAKRPFKCDLCNKSFKDKQTLKEHFPSHMKVKPFQCHICGRYLNRYSRLKKHIMTHELEAAPPQSLYTCPKCGEVYPTEDKAVEHSREGCRSNPANEDIFFELETYDKVYLCEYCDHSFRSHDTLNTHRDTHEEPRLFACSFCGVNFSTFSRLQTHKVRHGVFKESKPRQESMYAEDITVAKMFGCNECTKAYIHWTYLAVHKKMKHAAVKHMYYCKECPASFDSSWGISYHRKTRHPEQEGGGLLANRKPFKCDVCGRRYVSDLSLRGHRLAQHPNEGTTIGASSFQCDECGKVFLRKMTLESHMRSHSGAKRFACKLCSKRFVHPSGLSSHMRRHAGDEPHACIYCGKRFLQRSDLKDHERKHTGEKPFPCDTCEKRFRTRAMWLSHVRIHRDERPFPCDICGQAFRRSYAMKNHRMIHTGERNFACYKCGMMFRIKQDLQRHERTKHLEDGEGAEAAALLKLEMEEEL